jgi:hypothetical protein
MLQLISLICCIVLLILTPGQMRKLRAGILPAKFKGDPATYHAAYRKQLTMLIWVGTVFGTVSIALGLFDLSDVTGDTSKYEAYGQFVDAAVWIAVALSMAHHRRNLDSFTAQGAAQPGIPAA